MTQWIGKNYKAACRQLMPVIFPLLIKSNPGSFQCSWAILDFIAMMDYTFYTKEILQYMSHALMQIDKIKGVFRDIVIMMPKFKI